MHRSFWHLADYQRNPIPDATAMGVAWPPTIQIYLFFIHFYFDKELF